MREVRRVDVRDVEAMRTVRLRALLDSPDAFGSTYEREAAAAPEMWATRIATRGNAHFLAWDDVPIGIVAIVRDDSHADAAWLVSMWVAPDARGSGVANDLVATALDWARAERITVLRLHVTDGNDRAERLYVRHGFARTGGTIRRERDDVLEYEMRCNLTSDGA
jgi:GNAT superfamily N-acetyltransferase